MKIVKRTKRAAAFEKVLLSYVEMCYGVARNLTHNSEDARDLTREVLAWAWRQSNTIGAEKHIKMKLLTALRERFLQDYCEFPASLRDEPALAERI